MTIALDLDDDALATLRAEAEAAGEPDAAALARRLVLDYCEKADGKTRGRRAVERMQRVPTTNLTADEIMEMTRGEV